MIKITNRKKFISLMVLLRGIVDEIDITFTEDKVIIKAIHASNSNILFMEIKKTFFEEYNVEKESTYTINLDDMIKILKICKDDILLVPEIDTIDFKSGKNNFKLTYFVGQKDERPKPVFEYNSEVEINTRSFFNLINECITIDAIGNFNIEDESFFLRTKSYKIKSDIHFEKFSIVKKDNISIFLDLELLNLSSELKNIFEKVIMKLKEDKPMTLLGEDELIKCEFVLANRSE